MSESDFAPTKEELAVINALISAWNKFVALPVEHADDNTEFRQIIHAAQDKVLSRPARRWLNS